MLELPIFPQERTAPGRDRLGDLLRIGGRAPDDPRLSEAQPRSPEHVEAGNRRDPDVCGIAPPSASPEIATASRRGRMPVHQMTVPTPPRSSRSAPGASRPMPSIGAHDGSLSASGASVPERSTCSSMARRSAARSRRRNGRARPRRRRSGHPPLPRPRAGRTGPPRGARAVERQRVPVVGARDPR